MDNMQAYLVGFDQGNDPVSEFYVYSTALDMNIAVMPTEEAAQEFAREWLAAKFGGNEFDLDNGCQFVHARSPNAGHLIGKVDVMIHERKR